MANYRALYLTPVRLDTVANAGVRKKVFGQLSALHSLGLEVNLLYLTEAGLQMTSGGPGGQLFPLPDRQPVIRQWNYYRYLEERYATLGEVDLVYIRYHVPTPAYKRFLTMLGALGESRPTVVCEVPTYPYTREFTGLKGLAYYLLDKAYAARLGQFYDHVVSFYPAQEIFGHRPLLLENALPQSVLRAAEDQDGHAPVGRAGVLELIGLAANLEAFHGYDRILRGMEAYERRKQPSDAVVNFTLISQGAEFEKLRKFSERAGLTERTTFLAPRVGAELTDVLRRMDIGIGTIARYRVGLTTDSSLKTREYCAFGVAQLLSAEDRSFPDSLPFVRYINNDDEPVDIAALADWYGLLKQRSDHRAEMLRYAQNNLSWRAQMNKVLVAARLDIPMHE